MHPRNIDVGDRRAAAQAGVPFKQAVIAVLAFYLVAATLNGRAIHEQASRRTYGPVRTVWMRATAPLHWVSTRTLDSFRSLFENVLEDEP